ncbi:MAG TPA: ArsR family transcriptional regulator [Ktedonobacteraceae bacterium]|nr:ArsR family transcriptional regulator [Ktedonobacteraceae bacterium]
MEQALSTVQSPAFLKLLAHDLRWRMLGALVHSDYSVQELVRLVDEPQNLVSYHLRRLRELDVVTERRSSADRRDIYYSLDLATFQALYSSAVQPLHPALAKTGTDQQSERTFSQSQPARVLFLCTANSARSQMAEALLRDLSHGQVEAFSAGSHPTTIHPYAIQVMASVGIDISQQRSKHFDEFSGQSFDRVITVCDRVRESCPTFPGDPERIHWSFPDPAIVEGSEEQIYHAFEQTMLQLTNRIRFLLILMEREKGSNT